MVQGSGSDGYPVFVGDLPLDTTEEELRLVFKTYGEVKRIKVLHDSRGPVGNAVVFYASKNAAEDSITVLHKRYKIREDAPNAIRVSWAVRGKASGQPQGDQRPDDERKEAVDARRPNARRERSPQQRRSPARLTAARAERSRSRSGGGSERCDYRRGSRAQDNRGRDDQEDGGRWGRWGRGKGGGKGRGRKDGGNFGGDGGGWPHGASSTRVYLERLPFDVTEQDIKQAFKAYGTVLFVQMLNQRRGAKTVSAIVRYETAAAAETAVRSTHNKYEMTAGSGPISAKFAKPNSKWD